MVGDKVLWQIGCVQLPPPLRKNRLFSAQLLLCKVLGRFAKVRTGRPAARTGHFETEISSLPCIPFRDKLI